jgi:hypothetical protein
MGGGAREGCWGMIYFSTIVTSTNPCFNRGAGSTHVLVSTRGRCCFKRLVGPITSAAHCAMSAGFVIRVVSSAESVVACSL